MVAWLAHLGVNATDNHSITASKETSNGARPAHRKLGFVARRFRVARGSGAIPFGPQTQRIPAATPFLD